MFTISSKLIRKLGPALLGAGAMLGLLVGGPELAAQRTCWGRPANPHNGDSCAGHGELRSLHDQPHG
jgi:hypothetical protein